MYVLLGIFLVICALATLFVKLFVFLIAASEDPIDPGDHQRVG